MRSKLEIIEPSQFAYQPNIGTVDALIKLLDDYTTELDNPNSKFIQSAALDIAFDRLQPAILIDKMHKYQFNTNITALVSSFLKDRAQCVKCGDQKSSYIESNVGAP